MELNNPVEDLDTRKVNMFGLDISDFSLDEATSLLVERVLTDDRFHKVYTPNVTQVVQLKKDDRLKAIYDQANLLVADGMPLIWLSRLLDSPIRERVTGADMLPTICGELAETDKSVFLLGGKEGVAEKAADELQIRNPGLEVSGYYSPPFGFLDDRAENERIVGKVKRANTDVLFVGLGFPKQEIWLHRHGADCDISLGIGVGAAFDFVAGTLNRAPGWMRNHGLEWFYRLLQEPTRLWRRYLVIGPQFIPMAVSEIVKRRFKSEQRKS